MPELSFVQQIALALVLFVAICIVAWVLADRA